MPPISPIKRRALHLFAEGKTISMVRKELMAEGILVSSQCLNNWKKSGIIPPPDSSPPEEKLLQYPEIWRKLAGNVPFPKFCSEFSLRQEMGFLLLDQGLTPYQVESILSLHDIRIGIKTAYRWKKLWVARKTPAASVPPAPPVALPAPVKPEVVETAPPATPVIAPAPPRPAAVTSSTFKPLEPLEEMPGHPHLYRLNELLASPPRTDYDISHVKVGEVWGQPLTHLRGKDHSFLHPELIYYLAEPSPLLNPERRKRFRKMQSSISVLRPREIVLRYGPLNPD